MIKEIHYHNAYENDNIANALSTKTQKTEKYRLRRPKIKALREFCSCTPARLTQEARNKITGMIVKKIMLVSRTIQFETGLLQARSKC